MAEVIANMRSERVKRLNCNLKLGAHVLLLLFSQLATHNSQLAFAGAVYAGKFYAQGDAKKPFFALTFDDGPGYITMDLLKLLEKYGVKASFFMLGSSVKTYPERALAVAKGGHLVCNHTYAHKNYFRLDKVPGKEKILDSEIVKAQAEIEKASGVRPVFLRMPNGYNRAWVSKVAAKNGYTLVNWTYGSDWNKISEEKMTAEYLENLKPGAIFLLHDGGGKVKEKNLRIVEKLLTAARKKGLKAVRLDELLGMKPAGSR